MLSPEDSGTGDDQGVDEESDGKLTCEMPADGGSAQ